MRCAAKGSSSRRSAFRFPIWLSTSSAHRADLVCHCCYATTQRSILLQPFELYDYGTKRALCPGPPHHHFAAVLADRLFSGLGVPAADQQVRGDLEHPRAGRSVRSLIDPPAQTCFDGVCSTQRRRRRRWWRWRGFCRISSGQARRSVRRFVWRCTAGKAAATLLAIVLS